MCFESSDTLVILVVTSMLHASAYNAANWCTWLLGQWTILQQFGKQLLHSCSTALDGLKGWKPFLRMQAAFLPVVQLFEGLGM